MRTVRLPIESTPEREVTPDSAEARLVDLSDVVLLLDSARDLLMRVDGSPYADTLARSPSSDHAEISRGLLAASAQLRRAACEVEAQYWAGRGFPDPLGVES